MTETTPAADSVDTDAVESAEADETATDTQKPDTDKKAVNAEAAKYRRRLREAQSQLETVTAQLDTVQRQQVESLLKDSGVKPQAVWAVTELAALLDDDGAVNPERVTEAIDAAREKFGIPKKAVGTVVPGVGNQPSRMPKGDAWRDAFAPNRR